MVIAVSRAIAFPPGTDHFTETVTECCGYDYDRDGFNKVGEWCRIFERMGRIRVKKSATIGPDMFDGDL